MAAKNKYEDITEVHCHHKMPKHCGGKDNYRNLVLVLTEVHRLIHKSRKHDRKVHGNLEAERKTVGKSK